MIRSLVSSRFSTPSTYASAAARVPVAAPPGAGSGRPRSLLAIASSSRSMAASFSRREVESRRPRCASSSSLSPPTSSSWMRYSPDTSACCRVRLASSALTTTAPPTAPARRSGSPPGPGPAPNAASSCDVAASRSGRSAARKASCSSFPRTSSRWSAALRCLALRSSRSARSARTALSTNSWLSAPRPPPAPTRPTPAARANAASDLSSMAAPPPLPILDGGFPPPGEIGPSCCSPSIRPRSASFSLSISCTCASSASSADTSAACPRCSGGSPDSACASCFLSSSISSRYLLRRASSLSTSLTWTRLVTRCARDAKRRVCEVSSA
mmetsp:Transcript_34899/g.110241  ORF Transcript_34899/g.110241 Transcript_34899/m.110241 type:complete len:327 (+) Transcript_34899:674-1654(+)